MFPMKSTPYLALGWLLTLVLTGGSASAARPAPNILVILTDDQRWDAMSCAGNRVIRTPNLDRLTAEGARFANVFVTSSLCSPGRASLLSGLYARQHGVQNNFTEYPNDLPNYPRRLKDAGYETAYVGKWHMGEDNDEQRPDSITGSVTADRATTSTTSSTSTVTGRSSPDAFLYEYNFEKQFPYTPNVRGIRTTEWKWIRYPHGDGSPDRFTPELYRLTDDPLEQHNLAGDPRYAAQRKKLDARLQRLSRQAGPDRIPVYEGIVKVLPNY